MERPNILFVMTDHTNAAAIAPGSPCQTPHLDALARRGLRFGRCYTTNAICSPARASLMTGLYPSAHGMWDCTHTQRADWVDVPADRFRYFSHNLADAGYRTGYFGKWHVEQSGDLARFGWQEHDAGCQGAAVELSPEGQVVVRTPGYRDYLLAGINDRPGPVHHPAFERGIGYVRAAASKAEPWCCFVSTIEPHDPYKPPREWLERYDLDAVPLPDSLRDACLDKPEVVRRMARVWRGLCDDDWRRVRASYWATVSWLDHELGRLLAALEETGQADRTIVVFTSDHGDMLGAHGLAAKGVATAYEEVYNIPLVLSVPGQTRFGEDGETLCSLVDLGPTLLDLCGVEPLSGAHGASLAQALHGSPDRRAAYAEFFGQRFVYSQRIVWCDQLKYVFSPGGIDELYNLADDPHERRNLIDEPAWQVTVEAMCGKMWRQMAEIGDDSLYNTHYATLRTAPVGPLGRS
ncbi:MAG: sulfatase-like hydrolase/transferase [Armatimonadetes bacterium]|nr:sulfatase-like hydrolase/transferase [Armatimonadota bacterium]